MADAVPNPGAARTDPIDLCTLGRPPIFDDFDVHAILEATGRDLLPGVNRDEFRYWLNNTVERTIRAHLTIRLDQQTLRKLKTSIVAYRDLSRALLHSEFPPPTPPSDWLADVEDWIEKAERGLAQRRSGGASHNVETMNFLPKALGLFHASFGIEPDCSVSWDMGSVRGAAFRFVRAVSSRARKRVEERGFSERVPPELAALANWGWVTDDAIGMRIKKALKLQYEVEEWTCEGRYDPASGNLAPITRRSRGHAWRLHSERFYDLIVTH